MQIPIELVQNYYAVIDFLDQGGIVLHTIFYIAIILWILICERFLYLYFFSKELSKKLTIKWEEYKNHMDAPKIRTLFKYQYSGKLFENYSIIKVLVAIAPLLGLFGTVYGMMELFDVVAQKGTGDAKAMASGISMATLPTMTGMAVAITGLFFLHKIKELADKKTIQFNDNLEIQK